MQAQLVLEVVFWMELPLALTFIMLAQLTPVQPWALSLAAGAVRPLPRREVAPGPPLPVRTSRWAMRLAH